MARSQRRRVAPPIQTDKEQLQDFASVIQDNLSDLFQDSHRHDIRTTAPATTEGSVSDIVLVNLSGTYYIYAKVANASWKRVALS